MKCLVKRYSDLRDSLLNNFYIYGCKIIVSEIKTRKKLVANDNQGEQKGVMALNGPMPVTKEIVHTAIQNLIAISLR